MSLDDIDIDAWTESEEKKGPAKSPADTIEGPTKGKAKGPTKGNTSRSGGANKAPPGNLVSILAVIPVGDIVFLLHTVISAYKNPEHKKSRARSTKYMNIAEWLDKVDANWHRFIPVDSFLKKLENKRMEAKKDEQETTDS